MSKMEGVRSMAALKDVLARIKPLVSPPVPTTDAETETVQVGAEIAFLESVNLSLNL